MSSAEVLEYRPTEDEPFMNPRQREYFRQKLEAWKDEILRESRETLENLQEESQNHPDMADRASSESDRALELRTRDRQRKLIAKIDAATRGLTAIARKPAIRSGSPGSMHGRSPRSALRRRKATSVAKKSTATNNADEFERPAPCGPFLLGCRKYLDADHGIAISPKSCGSFSSGMGGR